MYTRIILPNYSNGMNVKVYYLFLKVFFFKFKTYSLDVINSIKFNILNISYHVLYMGNINLKIIVRYTSKK